MRTMAWTEPTSIITSIWQRNTTKVGADTNHNKPLGILHPFCIFLRITKRINAYTVGQLNIIFCAPSNEDGLTTPFYSDCCSRLNVG
eukprot:Gb_24682 [translate_table: standard]